MFADVIVNIPSSNVDQKFEYYVPQELEEYIDIDEWLKTNANINNMQTLLINPTPQKNR